MSKILIVGNILKDIYLKLDPRNERFELDEDNTSWLNLGFNNEGHRIFERVGVFGGAFVTFDVLERLGITTLLHGTEKHNIKAADYRYILCDGDDGVTYFVPSKRTTTQFQEPEEQVDWIFVDRSAVIDDRLAKTIIEFINKTHTKMAIYAPKLLSQPDRILIERADLIFAENHLQGLAPSGKICTIGKNSIEMDGEEVFWTIQKTDFMTHLTINSILAASFLGASLLGKSIRESLLYAKVNLENATLNETLDLNKLSELVYNLENNKMNLRLLAKSLVSDGKGILAADESGGSIHKKFESMDIPDDEQHRRDYRNIFFTTPDLEKYVNGVILFDETSRQKADDGQDFVTFLTNKGIIPGIKVDLGLAEIPGSEEKYTKGLEGLNERLSEYYKSGLRFAKWRAAFEITANTPSDLAIEKNCQILAEYAKLCQTNQIVPIVEPEVVYDGEYNIEKSATVTGKILDKLFDELLKKNVDLGGCILKVNMVLAGKRFATQSTSAEIGKMTAEVLREHVPEELAGVVFLSGGQTVEQATENLQAVTNNGPFPWPVTFSFARALQGPALEAWRGDNNNCDLAREAFRQRLIANCEALKKN